MRLKKKTLKQVVFSVDMFIVQNEPYLPNLNFRHNFTQPSFSASYFILKIINKYSKDRRASSRAYSESTSHEKNHRPLKNPNPKRSNFFEV